MRASTSQPMQMARSAASPEWPVLLGAGKDGRQHHGCAVHDGADMRVVELQAVQQEAVVQAAAAAWPRLALRRSPRRGLRCRRVPASRAAAPRSVRAMRQTRPQGRRRGAALPPRRAAAACARRPRRRTAPAARRGASLRFARCRAGRTGRDGDRATTGTSSARRGDVVEIDGGTRSSGLRRPPRRRCRRRRVHDHALADVMAAAFSTPTRLTASTNTPFS